MRQLVAAQQGLASGANRRPAGPARPTRAPTLLSWRAAPCADTGFLRARSLVISHASTKLLKPQLLFVGVAQAGDGMSPDKTQWGGQFDGHVQPPRISKPDQEFASAGLEFVEGTEGILLTELNDLFQKVNFPRRDPEKLRIALENTYHVVWVRATRQSRMARMGQLIGFARATSDGSLSATIWDVAVNPAWQRVGLGRAMMERLTKRLVEDGIPTITLYAEPGVVRLYEKLGFVKDPEGIRGLAFQRKKKERVGLATPSLR